MLAAGTHNYICNVTATQNYSDASNLSTYLIDYHPCDLNRDGIYLKDWSDLMSAYNCFLAVERNCNTINMQGWNLMKQEYSCFNGNY